MKIDADHIAFTDDGHAWWVIEYPAPIGAPTIVHVREYLGRPCDNCDGAAFMVEPDYKCPECIDGRHTFKIEVECCTCFDRAEWCGFDDDGPNNPDCSTGKEFHRVSVVPGMVLPIINCVGSFANFEDFDPKPCVLWMPGNVYGVKPKFLSERGTLETIALPVNTEPGMYAVKVKVES